MTETELREILSDNEVHQFDWFECCLDNYYPDTVMWWPIGYHNEPVFSSFEEFLEKLP